MQALRDPVTQGLDSMPTLKSWLHNAEVAHSVVRATAEDLSETAMVTALVRQAPGAHRVAWVAVQYRCGPRRRAGRDDRRVGGGRGALADRVSPPNTVTEAQGLDAAYIVLVAGKATHLLPTISCCPVSSPHVRKALPRCRRLSVL